MFTASPSILNKKGALSYYENLSRITFPACYVAVFRERQYNANRQTGAG